MSEREFAMPDLGEGLTESELVCWEVAVGDTVELNQVIAEVETAKALVQLPSPWAGTVARLLVEPGVTVRVGAPIVAIDVADAAADGEPETPAAAVPGPAVAGPAQAPTRNAVLVGYGPPVEGTSHPQRRARGALLEREAPAVPPAPPAAPPREGVRHPEPPAGPSTTVERPLSTPPVRKLAADLGVDLAHVHGTGERGMITRDDVLRGSRPAPSSSVDRAGGDPDEIRIPIAGVRRRTAEAMVASAFTAPQATVFLTVDVTPSLELLEVVRGRAREGARPGILALVAKALCLAVARTPGVNARWDEAAGEIVQYRHVNLGIAVATGRGLIVPNVPRADELALDGLASALAELSASARAGTTTPAALRGGTITISNVGVFGVDAGTPILVPGESAILALGAITRRPWEHRGEIALRSVMTLSLSFDHRVVDGQQAATLLADVGAILAEPGLVLAMV